MDVMKELLDMGLDTIAYMEDPVDKKKMVSVVTKSLCFTLE